MNADTIEIVPIERSHLERASSLLADAFLDEPGAVATIRRSSERRLRILQGHFADQVNLSLKRRASRCALLDGEIVGVMLMCAPGEVTITNAEMIKLVGSALFRVAPAIIWRGLRNSLDDENHRPKEPNYFLETLGVDPKLQGRGIGSTMLDYLTGLADKEQVLVYLSTTYPRTIPLYQKFEFQIKAETNSLGIPNYHMVREPKV